MDKKPLVLIVDDVPANIYLLAQALEADYEVKVATDGPTAIEIANLPDQPDLILLDVLMPGMDGYEVCRRLKATAATRDIPILFVTARAETDYEMAGLSIGAADYIIKPANIELIRLRVRNHLELKHQRDELRQRTAELEKAMAELKVLKGLLPICCHCKKIRDDNGYWEQLEVYICEHSEAEFSHGICPECAEKLYPDFYSPNSNR